VSNAISWGVLVGFVAAAIVACGDTKKNSADESAGGSGGSGAIPVGGNAGATDGGTGPGAVDSGGNGGTAVDGSTSTSTGMGTTGDGGTSAAGAPPTDGSGGDAAGGSTSSGGTSSGGTSTMSSTGSIDLMDPPADCESVSQSEDADTCSYEYRCDGRTHFDSCRREAGGTWGCDCGTFSTASRNFEIEGIEGLEACGVIARICESDDVPVSPERTCRAKESGVEDDTCAARATCGNELDLTDFDDVAEGIVVREVQNYRSECQPVVADYGLFVDGFFDCSCDGDTVGHDDYMLSGASVEDLCEPLVWFCTTDEPPAFATDRVCFYSNPSGIVEQTCPTDPDCQGCSLYQECRTTAPIGEGVAIVNQSDSEYKTVVCRPEEGELHCACQDNVNGVYGDDTVPSNILEVCSEAREICPAP